MNPVTIIARKRDGCVLRADEIAFFLDGFSRGEIPDYQMAALAMAIYLRGMDATETAVLTEQMLRSGSVLDRGRLSRVDKHSTGGVGDKTSLILAPLLACCGLCVPMISGRGLGPTGGTLDKLESIAGFRTDLEVLEIQRTCERVGCVISGATAEIAPADRRLYALRDVTATVASIPLITASIMSKKLAENLDALVLDVKFGSGAFMKTQGHARQLARSLVETGRRMGVKTVSLLTDMNQPLGRMVGNAVEVDESLQTLSGGGPDDLRQLCLELAGELLVLTGCAATSSDARIAVTNHLDSGRAMEKFRQMVEAQGGNLAAPRPRAPAAELCAPAAGYLVSIASQQLGQVVIELGGGRRMIGESIDPSVGLEMLVRIGEPVEVGQPLIRVFTHRGAEGLALLEGAMQIESEPPPPLPLVAERI